MYTVDARINEALKEFFKFTTDLESVNTEYASLSMVPADANREHEFMVRREGLMALIKDRQMMLGWLMVSTYEKGKRIILLRDEPDNSAHDAVMQDFLDEVRYIVQVSPLTEAQWLDMILFTSVLSAQGFPENILQTLARSSMSEESVKAIMTELEVLRDRLARRHNP